MKRKVIKQAGQAYTTTLPIDWVRQNNIKEGDEVEMTVDGKDILIHSDAKQSIKKISLDLKGFSDKKKYFYINSAYSRGIDEISVTGDEGYLADLSQVLGYAVVSQNNNIQTIKDISGAGTENLDELFKRIFQMLISFYSNAISDISECRKTEKEKIKKIDSEINKFALFLERSIIKCKGTNAALGNIMFAQAYALEKIGDSIVRLWKLHSQKTIKLNLQAKEMLNMSYDGLVKSFEIYYQTSDVRVDEIMNLKTKIYNCFDKLEKVDIDTMKFINMTYNIFQDAYDMTHLSLMKRFVIE